MKKIYLCMLVTVTLLVACEPAEEKYSNNAPKIAESELAGMVSFTQTDEYGNPQTDGNYFMFTTNPATVIDIYTFRPDGSENMLSHGVASGTFKYAPSRGSDPTQTLYLRAMNADGGKIVSSKTVTVFVPGELEPAIKLLASNDYGSKVWKWDTTITGAVWGNMGYCGGAGSDVALSGNGQWWGCTSEEDFKGQLMHTEDGAYHGDGNLNATMVITEDGLITCYDENGNQIRQGTYKVEDYDPSNPSAWKMGHLVTTPGAILWPYEINSGGNMPTTFEICYLSSDKFCLVYPDGGDFSTNGSWGEASFWHFASDSDQTGMLAGYDDGKSWTWDTSVTGAVWGNMGYCGGSGADVGISGNGQWWGVTNEEEFMGQMMHSDTGVATGEESMDAYMTFTPDGLVTSFDANGNKIRGGTYELEPISGNEWKVAHLKTTEGSILWPFEINSGGNKPSVFELVYLTGSQMTLVYPDGGDFSTNGSWGEASFWHFKKKN